jgi:hypothetical protein
MEPLYFDHIVLLILDPFTSFWALNQGDLRSPNSLLPLLSESENKDNRSYRRELPSNSEVMI